MFSFSSSLQCFISYSIPALFAIRGFPRRDPVKSVSAVPDPASIRVFSTGPAKGAHWLDSRFLLGFGRHASGAFSASRPRRLRRLYTGLTPTANRPKTAGAGPLPGPAPAIWLADLCQPQVSYGGVGRSPGPIGIRRLPHLQLLPSC